MPLTKSLRITTSLAIAIFAPTLFVSAQSVTNQNNSGYPENAIIHGTEIESVQTTNGNLHIQIPIYTAKGRGLNTYGNYVYDNKEWFLSRKCYSSGICQDTVTAQPGSNMTITAHGPIDYSLTSSAYTYQCDALHYAYGKTNIVLREPDGTKHHFLPDPVAATTQFCAADLTITSTLYADDGSGWQVTLDPSTGNPKDPIRKDGTHVLVMEDSNGNELTRTSTTQGTDTLGRTFYDGSSYAYSASSAQYIDSTNTLRSASVTATTSVAFNNNDECYFSDADTCASSSGSWTVPSEITLPDGGKYTFTYASGKGAEIASITLPTGGSITYTYGAWQDGGRPVATRKVVSSGVSGTWTYTLGASYTTIMSDPAGNDTVFDCSAAYYGGACTPKFTKYYSGSYSSGTLMKTVSTDYTTYTFGSVASSTIKVPTRSTTTWNQTNQVAKTETDWDTKALTTGTTLWKNPLEVREYDFGTGSAGVLLRRTHYNYLHLTSSSYLTANIADRATSKIVYDGASNIISQTTYAYDGTAVSAQAGVPGHDDTNYGTSNNVRGNLTSTSEWRNLDGTWLTTTYTYDQLGNRKSMTDPLGHQTTYSYSDSASGACSPSVNTYAYLTQTTDAKGFRVQNKYFYCNGLLASTRDENDIVNSRSGLQYVSYDGMNRPTQITQPNNGNIWFGYLDSSVPNTITETTSITTSPTIINRVVITELDGLGRTRKSTLTSDPDGATYTRVGYDSMGRIYQEWNPTRCDPDTYSSCTGETTFGYITHQYDALSRENLTLPQGGSVSGDHVTTTYSGPSTTVVDEAGVSRTLTRDGLNRIVTVTENNPGWTTKYTYDPLGKLTCVEQHGNAASGTGCSASVSSDASSPWRVRRFVYDSLGHLLAEKNPEAGTSTASCNGSTSPWSLCYTYNNDGVLASKTDARGITANYNPSDSPIDSLNRITKISYSNGDPSIVYTYDSSTVSNGIHHRTGMSDGSGTTSWAYDTMGHPSSEVRTIGSVQKTVSTAYNYDESVLSITYPSGAVLAYSPGGAGRPIALNDTTHAITYATSLVYAPQGALKTGSFGSGITRTDSYNPRLQPLTLSAAVGSTSIMSLTYNFGFGTNDNGNVYGITNNKDTTRSEAFTYDTVNRITKAQAGSRWGVTFTYDAWGNLYQTGSVSGTSMQPMSVNQSMNVANRFTLLGYTYDSAGNTLSDGINSGCSGYAYSWNADELMTCGNGATYVYNGDGSRVKKSGGSSTSTLYWGGEEGAALAESDLSGTITSEYVFLNGKRIARRDVSSSTTYYYFQDMLGSSSTLTTSSGTVVNESDYAPYGAEIVITQSLSNQHYKFTGKERDSESGLDYFGARYFANISGRFMSPDWSASPSAVPYAMFENPQTLNLYAFVKDNPESLVDSDGHAYAGAFDGNHPDQCGDNWDICGNTPKNAKQNATSSGSTKQEDSESALRKVHDVLDPASDWVNTNLAIPVAALELGANEGEDDIALDQLSEGSEAAEGAFEAKAAAAEQEVTIVYQKVNSAYVGITNNLERREAEHGEAIQEIVRLPNRVLAKAVEQAAILQAGLGNLTNKINSIATGNPIYQGAVEYGQKVLQSIGFKW